MRNLAIALVAACGGSSGPPTIDAPPLARCTPTTGTKVTMRKIGAVGDAAMIATAPPNDGRLFVVERQGRIRIFDSNETLRPDPFLDISNANNMIAGGEQGLLGLAFDPDYAHNRLFYVWYTANNPTAGGDPYLDVLERFTASATDLNKADPASGVVLLSISDFASNHNAGMIEFGPDGFLYASTGDGGGGGDPNRNAQNPMSLLGKMLRIDTAHPAPGMSYGIPADNPYVAGGGAPEVYMLGLRNPWRWSFDRMTGDLWIGDVGQGLIEEVDVLPAGEQKGKNLGWSMWEGSGANSCYGNYTCDTTGMTFPLFTRTHAQGWVAVIGGQVYRGSCYPDLGGYYFFTDNGAHGLVRAKLETPTVLSTTELAGTWPSSPASIHADARGELYETTTDGSVYHLEAGP